jgi:hypothetical protein
MKLDHTKHLNRQEAERAVYLDFESHKEGPPFLAGVLVEDTILQVTFDPTLQIAARQAPRGTETGSLAEFVDGLLERCEREGRLIVGYSKHELETIGTVSAERQRKALLLYRDANKLAKSWMYREHPTELAALRKAVKKQKDRRSTRVGLKDYVGTDLVDFEIPDHLKKDGLPTEASRIVREQLEERGEYNRLAKHAKRRWTTLLQYNEVDCRAMQALVLAAVVR